ncbi:ran GTPase-activating protein 1 [Hyalella azteca]|uniref:Ran GTPase-activating protein 1 n=1 Tax=Hyalella azteca TaxID=294128 RepID=A0A8B7P8G0_HYAAZ|nr:ran GTPase-activating protein 1 [Hyalella azteca]
MDSTLSFAGQSNKWNTADDAAPVAKAIEEHPNLVTLDLENNTLGPDAAKVIGDALAKHPEFKRAHFKDLFTGRLKTEIPLALKHLFSGINRANAQLVELDLSDNALGPVGVEGMVDFMSSRSCYTLEELRLNNNGLGITGGTMLAKSLEKLIDNSTRDGRPWKLKVFIAGRNRLEKVGAKIYAGIFRRLGSLEEVAMPQNGIFHEGIAALAEALSHNPNLRVLNLNDNTFTKKGGVAMAKYLPKMQALEVINFGDCLLKTSGASALAVALMPGHMKLKELYLDGNELTAEGGLSVVEAVQNKPNLTKLMMDDNMFGERGQEMIENFLRDVGKLDAWVPLENNAPTDSEEEQDDDEDEDDNEDDESESSEEDSEEEKVAAADESDSDGSDVEVVSEVLVKPASKTAEPLDSSFIVGPISPVEGTAAEYVCSPTAARLLGLPVSQLTTEALTAAATADCTTPDQEISSLVRLLVQSAALSHTDDKQLLAATASVVQTLGKAIFSRANQHLLVSFTTNTLLVYLGLIKCEDKNFSVTWEQRGVLKSLAVLVKETYFPQDAKNTLQYFISRPSQRLDELPDERDKLLQALAS